MAWSETESASRPVQKWPALGDDSDAEVDPDADERADAGNLAESARGSGVPFESPHAPQLATHRSGGPRTEMAAAASAPALLPSPVLLLKSENFLRRLPTQDHFADDADKYTVVWDKRLGWGAYGIIYEGIACRVANRPVTIKIFLGRKMSEQAQKADAEVRRYVALFATPRPETSGHRAF